MNEAAFRVKTLPAPCIAWAAPPGYGNMPPHNPTPTSPHLNEVAETLIRDAIRPFTDKGMHYVVNLTDACVAIQRALAAVKLDSISQGHYFDIHSMVVGVTRYYHPDGHVGIITWSWLG